MVHELQEGRQCEGQHFPKAAMKHAKHFKGQHTETSQLQCIQFLASMNESNSSDHTILCENQTTFTNLHYPAGNALPNTDNDPNRQDLPRLWRYTMQILPS